MIVNEVMCRNHLCFWMQFSNTYLHKYCQWSYAQNHLCFWMQFSNTLPHKDCQWSYASKPSVFECNSVTHCHTKIVNEVKLQNHLCKIVSDIQDGFMTRIISHVASLPLWHNQRSFCHCTVCPSLHKSGRSLILGNIFLGIPDWIHNIWPWGQARRWQWT